MSHPSGVSANAADEYDFLVRRLHSLSGIIPVGVFLVFHILINSTVLDSPGAFQGRVDQIHSLGMFLVPVEIIGIFIPLFFHGVFGLKIILSGRPNPLSYPYAAGWRYALQRWTGVIAFVFIVAHIWHMHWTGRPFGGSFFDPHDATRSAASAIQRNVLWAPLYAIGVMASVYHFCNGIWTALITWGITIGANAQRKAGYVCAALGVGLAVMGLATVSRLRTADFQEPGPPTHAQHVEPQGAVVHADGNAAAVRDRETR